jgi:hypothetical protein
MMWVGSATPIQFWIPCTFPMQFTGQQCSETTQCKASSVITKLLTHSITMRSDEAIVIRFKDSVM